MARTKVFARIYLNNKLVHTTTDAQLQNDFSVKWAQIFNIYVLASTLESDSIVLAIHEYTEKSRDHFIAEICLPTPDPASTNYQLDDYEFSSQAGN